jgi:phage terminase large subunit-like protein
MLAPDQLARYANDFAAFCDDAVIPQAVGRGVRFGDVMHPYQRQLITDLAPSLLAVATGKMPARQKFWAEMTKGCGKDLILALAVIWLLIFAQRQVRIQLGAADQDQAAETHRSIVGILNCWPWLRELIETPAYRVVCKSTSSDAEVLAADTAGSHGAVGVDLLILNELHAVTKWEFIENLADNASKNPACVTIACTNAGFKSHPAWKWREIARTSSRWSFHQYAQPAPHTDPAEIEEASRRNSTERFRRLWWGVWSSGSGDALDEADIQTALDSGLAPMLGRDSQHSFVIGLDLGIRHDHSGAVVLGAHHATQRVRLAASQSWAPDPVTGKVDLIAVKAWVADAHRRFRLAKLLYDPYQAELMAMQLQRECNLTVEPMQFSGANLNLMATTLLETFRSRRIDLFPQATKLAADIRKLTIVEKSYGHRLDAVSDSTGHADEATALAIALPHAVHLASQKTGPGCAGSWGGPITVSDTRFGSHLDSYNEHAHLHRRFFGPNSRF